VRGNERGIVREGAGDTFVLEAADVRREEDIEDVLREIARWQDALNECVSCQTKQRSTIVGTGRSQLRKISAAACAHTPPSSAHDHLA